MVTFMSNHQNCASQVSVNTTCDLVIADLLDANTELTVLKVQKLLYYCQAWHMAFYDGRRLFDGPFEAWVHGPVNRTIYDLSLIHI